jgi:hypothetical protein
MNEQVNKQAQLTVVVVGFFATLLMLFATASTKYVPRVREMTTLGIALACAIRYWWVILLLAWPATWFRLLLLLLAWCALPAAAAEVAEPLQWAVALAALAAIGCGTEIYNGLSRQWDIGSAAMAASVKRDHLVGAIASVLALAILVFVILEQRESLDVTVAALVVADWIRLIMMINRHQRFLENERPT